ncbi:MAG TPA: hypothetical protein VNN15_08400, partial [Solirubrobacterales bacterium]|nr:hypothetical protein [Solirubrobacterales bacterium]
QVQKDFREAVGKDVSVPADGFEVLMQDALGGAGLLHDLGHPPFSHVLEPAFRQLAWYWLDGEQAKEAPVSDRDGEAALRLFTSQRDFHESVGEILLEQLIQSSEGRIDGILGTLIRTIIEAPLGEGTWASALHGVIAGEIDVDRLDYLMRDAQRAGTEFGSIDWERLVDALELHAGKEGGFVIAPGARARSAVETVLLQRAQSYKWITFHPRVVGANLALGRAVELLVEGHSGRSQSAKPELPGLTPPPFPDLNYILPREKAVTDVLPKGIEDPDSISHELIRGSAGSLVQSSVDDGRLLEHLKKVSIEVRARLLRPEALSRQEEERLKRLRAYLDTVLVRRKTFVPAWKTVDEFRSVVDRLIQQGLADQVKDAFQDLRRQFSEDKAALSWLEPREKANLKRLEDDDIPVAGVNHLMRLLVADQLGRQQLCELLATQQGLPEGFWEVQFVQFRAVRDRGNLAVLFNGFEPVPLIETSPLIKALQGVDEGGTSLFAYYFVTAEEGLNAWAHQRLGLGRERLRGAFVKGFPEFVHMGLKRLLEEFLRREKN